MRLLIGLLSLGLSCVVFAEQGNNDDKKAEMFEKHKSMMLEHIEQKITAAQSLKSCVSSAKGHDDMKACHQAHEKTMHDFESKRKEHRKEMLDEKIKRLQDEKAKLEQNKEGGK